MPHIPINFVYEDQVSEFAMLKIVSTFAKFTIGRSYGGTGSGYIKKNIGGFNEAAKGCPFFVLADLDNVECPPSLLDDWLDGNKHPNLIFRIAVREIEAWLLADRIGFSQFTGIAIRKIPTQPETLDHPKETLIELVKRSRKRDVKGDIVPRDEFAKTGPNYNERLMKYVSAHWNINRARHHSPSLQGTVERLGQFNQQLQIE